MGWNTTKEDEPTVPPDQQAVAKRTTDHAQLCARVKAAHAEPRYDLGTEPWIPVHTRDGNAAVLGLGDVLLRAHELADLAEPNPLTRAALRRYLTAITALLVHRRGADHEQWSARLRVNTGFDPEQVHALLAAQADHLWLYHPATPFLQDRRLITAMLQPKLMPVAELVAHLPGETEAAWFTKRTDPDAAAGLTNAEAARALATRWFYTLNGNSADVDTSAGKVSAQAGSAFAEGPAPLTHVFRVSETSLFATLLRNLTTELVEGVSPAWADPARPSPADPELIHTTAPTTPPILSCQHRRWSQTGPAPVRRRDRRRRRIVEVMTLPVATASATNRVLSSA